MTTAVLAALAMVLSAPPGGSSPAPAEPVVIAREGRVPMSVALERIAQADVAFIGENHDHRSGHAFELQALDYVTAHRPKVVLALEMFERDVQLVVDEYLAGLVNEASFLAASRPWANYRTDYRPLVELCRERHVPVVGSNAPRRYVNLVSRRGPEALRELSAEARRSLAPLPIRLDMPAGYSAELDRLFGGAHTGAAGGASSSMPSAENMKAAQALWDATMADSIIRAVARHRGALVLHINGSMHSDYGYGIVDRVRKRAPRLKVVIVTVKPDAAYPTVDEALYERMADIAVVFPPEAPDAPR